MDPALLELQAGQSAYAVDYSPNGRCLAAGTRDGIVHRITQLDDTGTEFPYPQQFFTPSMIST